MDLAVAGFDWDKGNWPKCGKHGVSREEIETLFTSGPAAYPDPAHSSAEQRFLAIGQTATARWLLVAFTLRRRGKRQLIRPISARYMREREVKHFEQQKQN
jgi:uncharacterized DUF497 family protein